MANSPARSVIDVGSVIADTYKIEALIGRGGMGAVFVASHVRLPGKQVAIKLLHAELHDGEVIARFRREAEIASKLGHPNICTVHDFNEMPDGTPYLILDYLEGQTLAQKIKDGPVPLEQIMSIVRQVGSALAAAHREGIVHRDLKPQNIFLIPTEVDGRLVEIAKVLDFGISKIVGSQTVKTQESTLLGTPQYMAPEQATGQHDSVDQRTDVFALGAIVYEMLNGHPAFSGASIPEVVFKVVYEQPVPMNASVPPAVSNAVKQAMAKPAAERFSTIGAFVEALTGVPLTNFRPSLSSMPEVGASTGSKRVSNREALANTMGSGDYTPPPAAVKVPGPSVRGSAPTVESGSRPLDVGTAPTSVGPAAAAKKKPWALLGAVVFAAAAVVVGIGAMGGGGDTKSAPSAAPDSGIAVVTSADKVEIAAAAEPKAAALTGSASNTAAGTAGAADTAPVGVAVETPPPVPANPTKPAKPDKSNKTGATPATAAVDTQPDGPADDPIAREQLVRAEAALAAGDLGEAHQLAMRVVNSAEANDGQQARALAIQGVIACRKNRDPERPASLLRQIRNAPRMQARIIKACRKAGIELPRR